MLNLRYQGCLCVPFVLTKAVFAFVFTLRYQGFFPFAGAYSTIAKLCLHYLVLTLRYQSCVLNLRYQGFWHSLGITLRYHGFVSTPWCSIWDIRLFAFPGAHSEISRLWNYVCSLWDIQALKSPLLTLRYTGFGSTLAHSNISRLWNHVCSSRLWDVSSLWYIQALKSRLLTLRNPGFGSKLAHSDISRLWNHVCSLWDFQSSKITFVHSEISRLWKHRYLGNAITRSHN